MPEPEITIYFLRNSIFDDNPTNPQRKYWSTSDAKLRIQITQQRGGKKGEERSRHRDICVNNNPRESDEKRGISLKRALQPLQYIHETGSDCEIVHLGNVKEREREEETEAEIEEGGFP